MEESNTKGSVPEKKESDGTVLLYRIENTNIKREPNGITSHGELTGQWFTPNLETALAYLRKSQQTFGINAQQVNGAHLVIVKIPEGELKNLHVSQHPIASKMDVENDNYIVPPNIERRYINLDSVQDQVGSFDNLRKARQQVRKIVQNFMESLENTPPTAEGTPPSS